MATLTAIAISVMKLSKLVDELTKRVGALEAASEQQTMAQKAMKEPPTKRRTEKAA